MRGFERAGSPAPCGERGKDVGRGGIAAVSRATGMARSTIGRGLKDLASPERLANGRVRREGGVRKPLAETDPTLISDLEALVEPDSRDDPMSPLRWTCKSLRVLAVEAQFGVINEATKQAHRYPGMHPPAHFSDSFLWCFPVVVHQLPVRVFGSRSCAWHQFPLTHPQPNFRLQLAQTVLNAGSLSCSSFGAEVAGRDRDRSPASADDRGDVRLASPPRIVAELSHCCLYSLPPMANRPRTWRPREYFQRALHWLDVAAIPGHGRTTIVCSYCRRQCLDKVGRRGHPSSPYLPRAAESRT